jgi:tetratricopeptide (TPR) repeat protein
MHTTALGENVLYLKARFDKTLAIHPKHIYALGDKGLALDALGNHTGAILYYDKALAIDPNDIYSLDNKGLSLTYLGNYTGDGKGYDLGELGNYTLQQRHIQFIIRYILR